MNASVIVPTYNRANPLHATLETLLGQEDVADYEVIVVDNGSTDPTKDVVTAYMGKEHNAELRYEFEAEPGLLAGRHRGAALARSEILVYVDDDILADRRWLSSVLAAFQDERVQIVGGPSRAEFERPPPSWVEELWSVDPEGRRCEWLSLIDLGDESRPVDPRFVFGLNLSIRKRALHDLGGFHPDNIPKHLQHYQGDGETGLTEEAARRSFMALYEPRASVRHFIPADRLTLPALEDRAFYQGVADSYRESRRRAGPARGPSLHAALMRPPRALRARLDDRRQLKHRLWKAQVAGYRFHQLSFRTRPDVREWVLRPNYWDYRLPRPHKSGSV